MNKENKKYGYIGLWRSLLSWEWFQEPNTLSVFIYCLLRACPKEDKWQGKAIKRGSFITSLATISRDTGLTVQQTRTALEHLETTGEITKCSTSKYSLITVKNYDFYQVDSKQNNKQSTRYQHTKRQTNNKLITTDKNKKRDKNSPDVAVLNSTPQVNKKPNYREMREFYCKAVGIDDAVLVDDFDRECRMDNDYSNRKQRLLKYRGDIGC